MSSTCYRRGEAHALPEASLVSTHSLTDDEDDDDEVVSCLLSHFHTQTAGAAEGEL